MILARRAEHVRTLGLLSLLSVALPAIAQQSGMDASPAPLVSVQTKNLYPDETVLFSTPAPVTVATTIKCGLGGDIFATYSSNPHVEVWESPIRKIGLSSRHVTEYPVPSIPGYQNVSRSSFDVDPNGVLYALVQARPQPGNGTDAKFVYFIVRYKDDGSVDSYYSLARLPERLFQPTSLTMFADGNSLVSGTVRAKDAAASTMSVFSAIFNQTGEYRVQVTEMKPTASNGSSSREPKGVSPGPAQQDAIITASSRLTLASLDGNVYVLKGEHLSVVPHSGAIEREIELPAPNKDTTAIQIASAGVGYLFASYDHLSTGEPGETGDKGSMIRVVNLQTGEITATYHLAPVERGLAAAACGVSINDFVFLGSDQQNNLEVVHYRLK